MKLFVTDYDDTLFTDELNLKENIKKLNLLRKNGFYIVISTGRSLPSIVKETIFYNIPYDYLTCADGSIIYDKDKKLVKVSKMKHDVIWEIINFKNSIDYEEMQVSYNDGYGHIMDFNKDISGINIVISNDNINSKIINDFLNIKNKYPNYNYLVYSHIKYTYLCVKRKNVSKALGVSFLKNYLHIKKRDIYVIGDSNNDLEMIRDYNGCCVINATKEVKDVSKKVYYQVYEYIDDILK